MTALTNEWAEQTAMLPALNFDVIVVGDELWFPKEGNTAAYYAHPTPPHISAYHTASSDNDNRRIPNVTSRDCLLVSGGSNLGHETSQRHQTLGVGTTLTPYLPREKKSHDHVAYNETPTSRASSSPKWRATQRKKLLDFEVLQYKPNFSNADCRGRQLGIHANRIRGIWSAVSDSTIRPPTPATAPKTRGSFSPHFYFPIARYPLPPSLKARKSPPRTTTRIAIAERGFWTPWQIHITIVQSRERRRQRVLPYTNQHTQAAGAACKPNARKAHARPAQQGEQVACRPERVIRTFAHHPLQTHTRVN